MLVVIASDEQTLTPVEGQERCMTRRGGEGERGRGREGERGRGGEGVRGRGGEEGKILREEWWEEGGTEGDSMDLQTH